MYDHEALISELEVGTHTLTRPAGGPVEEQSQTSGDTGWPGLTWVGSLGDVHSLRAGGDLGGVPNCCTPVPSRVPGTQQANIVKEKNE